MPDRIAPVPGESTERLFEAEGVSGVLHSPAVPTGEILLLTHGAGSNRDAPLLVRVAGIFAGRGWMVLRYDLPFRQQRPKGPPMPAHAVRDREGIERVAEAARRLGAGPVFAGGHSYGGRQTAMLAAEKPESFAGLLLLSYPLHPPGKPEKARTAFFPALRTPALFVLGDEDPFAAPEELRDAQALIPAPVDSMAIRGAGHDLKRGAGLGEELVERLRNLGRKQADVGKPGR